MPCHPARARKLLKKGRAVVVRLHPFTIRLRDRVGGGETQEVELKVDPGAKTTGLALVREDGEVLFLAEITHRGARIRKSMQQRRNYRRRRRSANLRYRKKRFLNRRSGTEAPALAAVAGRQRGLVDGAAAQARARDLHRVRGRPVRHPGAGEPGDRGRGVPAGDPRRLRGQGVPAREVGTDVRLLRRHGHAAANRPRAPEGKGRLRPGLEPGPCVPVLQPGQGRAAGRGLPGRNARSVSGRSWRRRKRRWPRLPPSTPPAASCSRH